MKVGTDAVLLGAWVQADGPGRILDIGTGCGVIALMLAQRYQNAQVDAIDIHEASFREAGENFLVSPWSVRMKAYPERLQDYQGEAYDLIVSNPPYFAHSYPVKDPARSRARNQESLDFKALITNVVRLLSEAGVFAVVLPQECLSIFSSLLGNNGFYIRRQCDVKAHAHKNAALVLLEAVRLPSELTTESLEIRHGKDYSPAYLALTKDFYLFS